MSGPVVGSHILSKKAAKTYNATRRITCPPLFWDCQLDLHRSCTSTSSTSVSQDSVGDDPTPSPGTTRSRSTRSRAIGDQLRDYKETKNKNKNKDIHRARRSPRHDLPEWLEELTEHLVDEEASASSEGPASISREPLHQQHSIKVVSGKHSILFTSRKTETAKSARGPKLQGLLVENVPVIKYFEQKTLVT